jgi:hypothetical protein
VVVLDDQDQAVGLKVAEEFNGQVNKVSRNLVWEQFENKSSL